MRGRYDPRVNLASIPANYRLRMPGPAAVPERVRAACALPVISHRGAEFRGIELQWMQLCYDSSIEPRRGFTQTLILPAPPISLLFTSAR